MTLPALTLDRFRAFAPTPQRDRLQIILDVLKDEAPRYEINTPARLHHFLAQVANESGGFARLEESLSYSAERLMVVWPHRFPTLEAAKPFERNAYALAEKVYGGRMGNTAPGEAWKYRGRGLMQLTGKNNYAAAQDTSGLELVDHPELAADADDATRIAMAFWKSHGCNQLADADDLKGITLKVNGGTVGLAERAAWLAKARKVFV